MSEGDTPDDRLRSRAAGSATKVWLLMGADRRLVTGLLVALVAGTLLAVGTLLPGAPGLLREGDPIGTAFQALLTATITGVTLVLTLNQLVLSQEFGAAGDQRQRMEEALSFREDVAAAVGAPVGPARPAQFLRALVQASATHADRLRDAADGPAAGAVADLADAITGSADRAAAGLDGAQFGEFDVVASALDFDYSRRLFDARRVQARHGETLDDEAREALEDLVGTLRLFGPAREHFKTLYFQWELIDLSRRILAAAVPALLVSAVMILYVDPAGLTGTLAGVETVVIVVAAAATVAALPFLLLLAYVMRIATVTRHTLSIGPFVLREADDVPPVEWD